MRKTRHTHLGILHSLLFQVLREEVISLKPDLDDIIINGQELLKHCSGDDSFTVQEKIDAAKTRYRSLDERLSTSLQHLDEALPLARNFHDTHEKLLSWLQHIEPELRAPEPTGPLAEKVVEVKH